LGPEGFLPGFFLSHFEQFPFAQNFGIVFIGCLMRHHWRKGKIVKSRIFLGNLRDFAAWHGSCYCLGKSLRLMRPDMHAPLGTADGS